MRTKIFALTLIALPLLPAFAGVQQGEPQDQGPPVETDDPVQADPVKTEPVETDPVETETEQVTTDPVETETAQAEQVTDPVETESAQAEQVTDPVETESAQIEQVTTDPVAAETAQIEQVTTDPVEAETAQIEQVTTDPVAAETAQVEQVTTDPVEAETAQTEQVQIDPLETVSAQIDEAEPDQVQAAVEETSVPTEARSLLHAVPEDAMLFCAVHDLDGIRNSARGNAWFRFFSDEQVRPIIDYAMEVFSEDMHLAAGDDELPFDFFEAIRSIHGSVQFFFSPAGETLEPAFGIVIDPGQARESFDEIFHAGLDLLDSQMVPTVVNHAGVDLAVFVDDGASGELDTLVVFEADDVVAFVSSVGSEEALEVARGMVDRLLGEDTSTGLTDRTELLEARDSVGDPQDFEFFVDLQDFSELVGLEDGMAGEGGKFFSMLGFDDMRWVFASASVGAGEALDFSLMAHVPESGLLNDIVGLMGPAPLGFARRMPVHSVAVGIGNFDVWGLYEVAMGLMEEHAPDEYAMMQAQGQGFTQMTGLDYEQDLLAQFTGDFGNFSIKVPEEEAAATLGALAMVGGIDGSNPDLHMGSASLIGLRDPATVEIFLDEILAMSPMAEAITVEDLDGHSVSSFSIPGSGFQLMWSFMDDAVVISPFPTALRAVLSVAAHDDVRSALKNKRFARALKSSNQAPMVSVTDTRTQVRGMLGAFAMLESMFGGGMFGVDEYEPEVEEGAFEMELAAFPPLPPATVADEYFHGTLRFSIEKSPNSVGMRFSAK